MPKRKLAIDSVLTDFLENITRSRRSKLRKHDHQDVTISNALVRFPVHRPPDARSKKREPRIDRQELTRRCNDFDLMMVRLTLLSLDSKPFIPPRPKFPKFALLPIEIRLIIWRLARPDPRIIKMSKTNTEWRGLRYGTDHLNSGVPVPSLLHVCYESRQLALQWYTLLFVPANGYGGTYLDTRRDYLYYGPEERYLLVNGKVWMPRIDEREELNLWIKDRHAISNIVVHYNGIPQSVNHRMDLIKKLTLLSRWCNETAKDVLFLGPGTNFLKAGLMLSDFGKQVCSFQTWGDATLDRLENLDFELEKLKVLETYWDNFIPRRMLCAELFCTSNVMQVYGYVERDHLDQRVHLMYDQEEADAAIEREEEFEDHIKIRPLN